MVTSLEGSLFGCATGFGERDIGTGDTAPSGRVASNSGSERGCPSEFKAAGRWAAELSPLDTAVPSGALRAAPSGFTFMTPKLTWGRLGKPKLPHRCFTATYLQSIPSFTSFWIWPSGDRPGSRDHGRKCRWRRSPSRLVAGVYAPTRATPAKLKTRGDLVT